MLQKKDDFFAQLTDWQQKNLDVLIKIAKWTNRTPLSLLFNDELQAALLLVRQMGITNNSGEFDPEFVKVLDKKAFELLFAFYGIPKDMIPAPTGSKAPTTPAPLYFTIPQLAKTAKITSDELFQILLDCSHVTGYDGVYSVADSGAELGGINCDVDGDDYGVFFPAALLNDPSIKEGIQELQNSKQNKPAAQEKNNAEVDWNQDPPQPPTGQAKNSNPTSENPADKDKGKTATKDKGKESGGWGPPEVGEPPF